MKFDFFIFDLYQILSVNEDLKILVFDCSGKYKSLDNVKRSRNIYGIGRCDKLAWRISSDSDEEGFPYTNVYMRDGDVRAHRWDDCEYIVDSKTGNAKALKFLK